MILKATSPGMPTLNFDGQKWSGALPQSVLMFLDILITSPHMLQLPLAERVATCLRVGGLEEYTIEWVGTASGPDLPIGRVLNSMTTAAAGVGAMSEGGIFTFLAWV